MLNDEQRRACNAAYKRWLLSDNRFVLDEEMFEAGIAYAQSQQSAMLAAERAAVVAECAKVCALLFEASRTLHREQMETLSDFTHGYRAGISTAEAAIRKLGEKRE